MLNFNISGQFQVFPLLSKHIDIVVVVPKYWWKSANGKKHLITTTTKKSRRGKRWAMGMSENSKSLLHTYFLTLALGFYFCLLVLLFPNVRDLYAWFIVFEYSPWVYCSIAPTQISFLSSASLSELSFFHIMGV